MLENRELFEVSRAEYKSFVETLRPEAKEVRMIEIDEYHSSIQLYSKIRSNVCLCARIGLKPEYIEEIDEREKYYIFEIPTADESIPPIPKAHIELQTKGEVQAFLNALSLMKEGGYNDRTLH